jgi:hypothetical protein
MATAAGDFCNVLAREKGLDPIGYAGVADIFIALELPLPWPRGLWQSAALPREVLELVAVWYGDTATPRPRLRPLVIAPEAPTSGHRRVLVYHRPEGLFANYHKREYLLPEAQAGALIWALLMTPERLTDYDRYLVDQLSRDILVCTHGAVDAACARFGFPTYKSLKRGFADETTRLWRVSHFGGHVFAPTLLELPAGRYWAYMESGKPERLLAREGDVRELYGHYRGWSALESGFLQAAEREVWMREGWGWFEYEKRGVTLSQDPAEEPSWAEVRLEFRNAGGTEGAYEARVELGVPIETLPSTGYEETYAYPQYRVVRLERVSAAGKEQT